MKRALPAVPVVAFAVAALAVLGRLSALGAAGTWLLSVALEGGTVALFWGGALGIGRWVARGILGSADPLAGTRAPVAARFAAEGGLGFAALMTLLHLLGLAGLAKAPVIAAVLLGGVAAALAGRDLGALLEKTRAAFSHPAVALAAPLAAVLLVAASFPPGLLWPGEGKGYDALEYHLQVPREWFDGGAIRALPHNLYACTPLNFEMLTLGVFALRGGPFEGMLGAQWLHASFALGAAALLALWAGARAGSAAGAVAGLAYLAVPWNLVTGSLAYNEQAAAFLGLAAFVLLWEGPLTHRVIAAAGACAGAAVGTKITAAGFFFLPALASALLLRDREEGASRTPAKKLALAALVFCAAGLAAYSPYLFRNAAWTHNPAFPFATRVLGRAHWSEAEELRFLRGHFPNTPPAARLAALWTHGLGDPQYGLPWLGLAAAGLGLGLWKRRALAPAAAVFVALQVLFWLSATHLQPRFLQPVTIPLALAAGLGAAALPPRFAWGSAVAMALGFSGWQGALLGKAAEEAAPPAAADALANPSVFADTLEGPLLKDRRPMLAGEARAFYFPSGTVYADPFETSPFAAAWRRGGGDPARVLDALRQTGADRLIVNWDEVERLRRTYGADPELNRDNVARLAAAGAKRLESPAPQIEILDLR